jgi:catechol 2,3-dioxygenase-like lactoylglutathione lyase family enzyme
MLASCRLVGFVGVRDAAVAKAFYGDKLGLPLLSEDGFALVFDAAGTMLRVVPVRQVSAAPYTVLGWEVPDIQRSAQELAASGVELMRFPGLDHNDLGVWTAPGGAAHVAWFKDPDGNLLSISQHAA